MKKKLLLCLIAITLLNANIYAQFGSAYVVPNFTHENPNELYEKNNDSEERLANISATFGVDGEWSFVLYSDGTFESRDWYGYNGHYDTRYMKDITTSSGTYYITRNENGSRIVHFRFRNGREKNGFLRYKNRGAELSYSNITHSEIQ